MKIRIRYSMVMMWGALSAAFFLGSAAYGASSPQGTWDCTVSGAQSGSAYLTFDAPTVNLDQTVNPGVVSGYIIAVPATVGHNSGINPNPTTFGYATLNGQWQMDGNQVVGFLYTPPSDPVRLDIASFRGTVSANGTSFPISAVTIHGNLMLSGVRFTPSTINPLPSTWTIEKTTQGKLTFTEVFTATVDATLGGGNLYDLVGEGADKCIYGWGALSRGDNFNISFTEYMMAQTGVCPSDPTTLDQSTMVTSGGVGKLNLQTDGTYRTTLKGLQEGSTFPKVLMPVLCQ